MDESKDEAKHESMAEMHARVEERVLARKKQSRKNRGTGARKAAHGYGTYTKKIKEWLGKKLQDPTTKARFAVIRDLVTYGHPHTRLLHRPPYFPKTKIKTQDKKKHKNGGNLRFFI